MYFDDLAAVMPSCVERLGGARQTVPPWRAGAARPGNGLAAGQRFPLSLHAILNTVLDVGALVC